MIKPHVLLGADGMVLQSTPGPANGKTTAPDTLMWHVVASVLSFWLRVDLVAGEGVLRTGHGHPASSG